ncbi:hypothetical protein BRD00_11745 [Halobacteriales archaeon QS_8_69_26]|nr:MAG: hypothetical protein BRD00_11745 [Halobacteriales archaeon QS_8_69_26]
MGGPKKKRRGRSKRAPKRRDENATESEGSTKTGASSKDAQGPVQRLHRTVGNQAVQRSRQEGGGKGGSGGPDVRPLPAAAATPAVQRAPAGSGGNAQASDGGSGQGGGDGAMASAVKTNLGQITDLTGVVEGLGSVVERVVPKSGQTGVAEGSFSIPFAGTGAGLGDLNLEIDLKSEVSRGSDQLSGLFEIAVGGGAEMGIEWLSKFKAKLQALGTVESQGDSGEELFRMWATSFREAVDDALAAVAPSGVAGKVASLVLSDSTAEEWKKLMDENDWIKTTMGARLVAQGELGGGAGSMESGYSKGQEIRGTKGEGSELQKKEFDQYHTKGVASFSVLGRGGELKGTYVYRDYGTGKQETTFSYEGTLQETPPKIVRSETAKEVGADVASKVADLYNKLAGEKASELQVEAKTDGVDDVSVEDATVTGGFLAADRAKVVDGAVKVKGSLSWTGDVLDGSHQGSMVIVAEDSVTVKDPAGKGEVKVAKEEQLIEFVTDP